MAKTDEMTVGPNGPLDEYREKASFPVEGLEVVFEPHPELLRLKKLIWRTLEADAVFQRPAVTPSTDEQKRLTARMVRRMHALVPVFLPPEIMNANYKKKTLHVMTMNEALAVYNRALSVKFALGVSLFGNALPSLGTQRHVKYTEAAWKGELLSCFAITEMAHGSNTKQLRTTATFDPQTQEFVMHTPDFEAAKCWSGNLGKTATFATVFAQLIAADGQNHGLHGFIVPIRDPKTLQPLAGVTVGDMGEKAGLNGIDNGFLIFNFYRIPKENLLNKTGDVDIDGNYQTSFKNPQQILGAALENLSAGRVAIAQESTNTLCCAMTVAVRYAAVRKQFGPKPGVEQPLLDYPTHHWRLFPYVAATCVFKIFISDFTGQYLETVERSYSSTSARLNELSEAVGEIHAIVSSCKPLFSWTCRDGIQVAREACGGHGYLKAAGLGDLRNDHDPSVTYEGDNTVLVQQTSNWLVRQWSVKNVTSPLHTIDFLQRKDVLHRARFTGSLLEDVANLSFVLNAYEWLLCWLMNETDGRITELENQGMNRFTARAHSQLYRAQNLSLIYAEYNILTYCKRRMDTTHMETSVRTVVERMTLIYGLWCLDKHLPFFYEGGFATGPNMTRLVRDGLVSLCAALKPDVVRIIDAFAPADFALNSVLGNADGEIYRHLEKSMVTPSATQRPAWWRDAVCKL